MPVKPRGVKQKIVSVHQSPMNAMRWLLVLECGHEEWVTATRRPVALGFPCFRCGGKAANHG